MDSRIKVYKLEELVNIKYGKSQKKVEDNKSGIYTIYGTGGPMGYSKEFLYNKPSILIGRKGSIKKVRYIDAPFWAVDTLFYTEINKNLVLPKFLYYIMSLIDFDFYNEGTTIPSLRIDTLNKIEFHIPLLEEQKAIAKILSDLDEKIEVNSKINKNLEEMAQAIFKHWFVDFEFPNEEGKPYKSSGGEMVESELGMIPKGWDVEKLEDVLDNIKMNTKPGEHLKERKYVPIDMMAMKSFTIKEYRIYEEAKSSLILFEKFDILMGAMRVYFHRVNLAPFKGITRTTTFVLRSKNIEDTSYNLCMLNLNETIEFANKTSKGTTMPYAIWENGLGKMKIVHPQYDLRKKFNEVVLPILKEMMRIEEESSLLKKLRDTLLPKLMSGEIRVPLGK